MTTAERSIPKELTDEEADRLAEIPEVADAIKEFQSIQSEFRSALSRKILAVPREEPLPDVSDIIDEFEERLDSQKRVIRKVALRYIQS